MTTLALECSTARGSIAARSGGELVFRENFASERGHGPAFFGSLERALSAMGTCGRVVVGLGPGSYSGVRIAISAAIGLELGLGCELAGIPSIAALQTDAREYIVAGDARRGEFFYARIAGGLVLEGPLLLTFGQLEQRLAAAGPLPAYSSAPIPGLPALTIAFPSAEILAHLGETNRGIIAKGSLEPLYLREPHITQPRVGS